MNEKILKYVAPAALGLSILMFALLSYRDVSQMTRAADQRNRAQESVESLLKGIQDNRDQPNFVPKAQDSAQVSGKILEQWIINAPQAGSLHYYDFYPGVE